MYTQRTYSLQWFINVGTKTNNWVNSKLIQTDNLGITSYFIQISFNGSSISIIFQLKI